MKKLLLFILFLTSLSFVNAQTPQGFKYQAIARDASGSLLQNQEVSFRISILKGSANGEVAYKEVHQTTTNNLGLVNLQIGSGITVSGTFSLINWGNDSFFVKIELDDQGGSNFLEMGTSQLLAVPYALFAHSVQNDLIDDADADPTNEIQTLELAGKNLTISGGNTISLPVDDADANPTNEIQSLALEGTNLSISNGNTVDLAGLPNINYWQKESGNLSYSTGSVAIGSNIPTSGTSLEVVGLGAQKPFPVSIKNNWSNLLQVHSFYDLDYTHSGIGFYKARGTKDAPTNVREGDRVGGMYSYYYYNNAFQTNAAVEFYVGSGLNTNSYPSYIKFGTTAAGNSERA